MGNLFVVAHKCNKEKVLVRTSLTTVSFGAAQTVSVKMKRTLGYDRGFG